MIFPPKIAAMMKKQKFDKQAAKDRAEARRIHMETVFQAKHFPPGVMEKCADDPTLCKQWANLLRFKVDIDEGRQYLRRYGPWIPQPVDKLTESDVTENVFWLMCCDFVDGKKKFIVKTK